nr:hypothetical protein NCPCFENI_01226 [Cupriavidus sp.]
MPWGVDEIKGVHLAITGSVFQCGRLGLNGNATLAFEVHGVEHLRLHLAVGQAATDLDDAVGQGALSMVDMGNNRKITNILQINNTGSYTPSH